MNNSKRRQSELSLRLVALLAIPNYSDPFDYSCSLSNLYFRFYIQAYDERDTTVGEGFFINNEHFDVHRFHPPLIYGRRGGPDDGEGIALCRVKPRTQVGDENYWFLLITYLLPILSAKAVPQMVKFSETYRKFIHFYISWITSQALNLTRDSSN